MKTKFRFTAVIMVLMAFVLTSFSSCEKDDVKPENGIEFPQELLGYWVIDELITPQGGTLTCENQGSGLYEGLLRNLEFVHNTNHFQRLNIRRCDEDNDIIGLQSFTYNENDNTVEFGSRLIKILQLSNQNLVIEYLKVGWNSNIVGSVVYYHKQ